MSYMQTGTWWTLIGLVLDLIGAFLLSVEAIKIRNLLLLRDRLLSPLRTSMLPPAADVPVPGEDVRVRELGLAVSDPAVGQQNVNEEPYTLTTWYNVLYWGWHLGVPLAALGLAEYLRHRFGLFTDDWIWVAWWGLHPLARVGAAVAVVVLAGLFILTSIFTLSCSAHEAIARTVGAIVGWLSSLEQRVERGVIGVVGFLFMAAGFGGQFVGSLLLD
jgi:hypothetical protein